MSGDERCGVGLQNFNLTYQALVRIAVEKACTHVALLQMWSTTAVADQDGDKACSHLVLLKM
ncbi:hypothetical protein J6590_033427 [Homalodisca vitripennis]|nr:hypothetical protein J6590_033427 [Homalodisca vitripennis]